MDELNTCPQGSCNMEGPVTSVDRADRVDPQPRVPKARATVSVATLVEMLPLHALVLTSIFGIVASVPPHVLSELGPRYRSSTMIPCAVPTTRTDGLGLPIPSFHSRNCAMPSKTTGHTLPAGSAKPLPPFTVAGDAACRASMHPAEPHALSVS